MINHSVFQTSMILIAHISDLHFGDKLINRGRGLVPHQRPHDIGKCMQLPFDLDTAMIEAGAPDDADMHVIVSGDLSVSGTSQQLAVAHAFLRSRPAISRLTGPHGKIGLDVAADLLGAIPGNHDHWDGNRTTLTAYNSNLFVEQFRATPWAKTWSSSSSELEIDVFGIDSNSGLKPSNPFSVAKRLTGSMARGRISDEEFKQLEYHLTQSVTKPSQTPTVRAIICHHSVSHHGGLLGTLELEPASRDRLLTMAADYCVSAILTGHAHISHYCVVPAIDSTGSGWKVHELRCSATVGWPSGKEETGFLFHRITHDGDDWTWDVWRYGWNGSGYVSALPRPWQTIHGTF
ncbi:metallophosphoesterase [Caballeronia sp. ATUFL_F1_KS39]|uniref:metallophosphoesterase family protein n=1 Tax=Caballeronia sp. ATUFL_F1_KS39 TaxID=2921766 RepID=UPI0020294364